MFLRWIKCQRYVSKPYIKRMAQTEKIKKDYDRDKLEKIASGDVSPIIKFQSSLLNN